MYRWLPVALLGTLLVGPVSLAVWRPSAPVHDSHPGPADVREARDLARPVAAYGHCDPDVGLGTGRVTLSDEPISPDQVTRLNVHHPDFTRWRGVVAIYPHEPHFLLTNFDPDHPERFARWGDCVVFGDPALIARLLARTADGV